MKTTMLSALRTCCIALALAPLSAAASLFVPQDLVTYDIQATFQAPVGATFADTNAPDVPAVDPGVDLSVPYAQPVVLFPEGSAPGFVSGIDPVVNVEVDLSPSAGAGEFLIGLTVTETTGEATTSVDIPIADAPLPGDFSFIPAECDAALIDLGAGQCGQSEPPTPDPGGDPADEVCPNEGTPPNCFVVVGPPDFCTSGTFNGTDCEIVGPETCPDLGTPPADCFHLETVITSSPVAAASLADLDVLLSDLDFGAGGIIVNLVTIANALECTGSFANVPGGASVTLADCSGTGFSSFEIFTAFAESVPTPVPASPVLLATGLAACVFARRRRRRT